MPRSRIHRRLATVLAAFLVVGVAAGGAQAAKTVRTIGGPTFERNGFIADSQRFSPGNIVVRPNERVTWVDRDRTRDPHTITFVNRGERPNNANQVFNCRACSLANAHLEDPNDPNSAIARTRVNVGRPGLNTRGDSLVLNGGRISGLVTARAGQTLYYMCAIHAWMQGSIRVTRAGGARAAGAELTGRTK